MLCELETDKVTVEVPSPADGKLDQIVAEEGATVGVDALLAVVVEAADQAGVKKDDLIQTLNGTKIETLSDLRIGLLYQSPGDRIRLTVQRKQLVWGEKTLELEFELDD